MYKDDGTPISSNSHAIGKSDKGFTDPEIQRLRSFLQKAVEVHLAVVTKVLFVDDPKNFSKNQVEYEVRVEFGDRHGQEYSNVKAVSLYGGNVQISETVYYPKTQILRGNKNKNNIYMFDHDGSQVVLAFMDGFPNRPFIIGGWANTNMDLAFAAKKADGIRKIEEFNGIRLNVNKDGEYIMTYYGGQRDTKSKKTANASTAPTTVKVDKTGAWSVDDKENQKIKIDRVAKKITLSQFSGVKPDETYGQTDSSDPGTLVNSIEMDKAAKKITTNAGNGKIVETLDGTAEKVTRTFQSGLSIVEDGQGDKVSITTAGGVLITVDGAGNKVTITAGSTTILIDGAGGKISLQGSLVDIGTVASALAILGPQLVSYLASHNHSNGNLGSPTGPPIVPPPASLLSGTVKIQE